MIFELINDHDQLPEQFTQAYLKGNQEIAQLHRQWIEREFPGYIYEKMAKNNVKDSVENAEVHRNTEFRPSIAFFSNDHTEMYGFAELYTGPSAIWLTEWCDPAGMTGCLWVDSLYVFPQHRRHGVGTRLLDKVYKLADRRRFSRILLGVNAYNTLARTLYDRQNYVCIETINVKKLTPPTKQSTDYKWEAIQRLDLQTGLNLIDAIGLGMQQWEKFLPPLHSRMPNMLAHTAYYLGNLDNPELPCTVYYSPVLKVYVLTWNVGNDVFIYGILSIECKTFDIENCLKAITDYLSTKYDWALYVTLGRFDKLQRCGFKPMSYTLMKQLY